MVCRRLDFPVFADRLGGVLRLALVEYGLLMGLLSVVFMLGYGADLL